MNLRWVVLVTFYLVLGLLGAWYLSDTTSLGADLATYQRAGEALSVCMTRADHASFGVGILLTSPDCG